MADRLPLFPLGTVLFPGALLPLHVFEQRYRTLVGDLLSGSEPRSFVVSAIREGYEVGADSVRALYDVGCVAVVRQVQPFPDGRFALVVQGTHRFRLLDVDRSRAYLQADVEILDEPLGDPATVDSIVATTRQAFATYDELLGGHKGSAGLPDEPTMLSYSVAAGMVVDLPERQSLLEAPDTAQRLGAEADLLNRELAVMRTLRAVPLTKPPLPPRSAN